MPLFLVEEIRVWKIQAATSEEAKAEVAIDWGEPDYSYTQIEELTSE